MSIKARNAHFTNWAKVVAALSDKGVTDEASARAFLANSTDNDFYYMVSYIKDTKEIYTHGQFYNCSEYDDAEIRQLIDEKISGIKMNDQSIAADEDGVVDLGIIGGDIYTYDYGEGLPLYGEAEISGTMTLEEYENLANAKVWRIHAEDGAGWLQMDMINNDSPESAMAAMKFFGTAQIMWIIFKGDTEASWSWTVSQMSVGNENYTETTYSNLMDLLYSDSLVPGTQYRITDYCTMTSTSYTQSANHQFDIIVTANSVNELNENARAALHKGDTYFANNNLSKWEIKYNAEGDTTKYAWATAGARPESWSTSWGHLVSAGTSTIEGTSMYLYAPNTRGTYLNSFSFYKATTKATSVDDLYFESDSAPDSGDWNNVSEIYVYYKDGTFITTLTSSGDNYFYEGDDMGGAISFSDSTTTGAYNTYRFTPDGSDISWFTAFRKGMIIVATQAYSGDFSDLYYAFSSQLTSGTQPSITVVSNSDNCIYYSDDWSDKVTYLSEITEENGSKGVIYYMKDEFNNECPYDFKNITFRHPKLLTTGYYTFSTSGLEDASLSATTYNNIIKPYYDSSKQALNFNVFVGGAINNYIGFDSYNNSFGTAATSNHIGNQCSANHFGTSCVGNRLMDKTKNNTFGNSCLSNIIYQDCESNTFGNTCSGNHLHRLCKNNTFGNNCLYNEFKGYCQYNTFGAYSTRNVLEAGCTYNLVKMSASSSGTTRNYFYNNYFGSSCSYNVLYSTETASSTTDITNVRLGNEIIGTSSSYNMINIPVVGQSYTIHIEKNSSGEIKQYCIADLIA